MVNVVVLQRSANPYFSKVIKEIAALSLAFAGIFPRVVNTSGACICLRPKACVLCLRPRACVLCLCPRASGPCLCPYPCLRASALQAHTVYPGPLCCFSRPQPAEALQGWKHVDSYSLISRAAWIQLYKKRQNSAKISAN